jgi:hypothetical protein
MHPTPAVTEAPFGCSTRPLGNIVATQRKLQQGEARNPLNLEFSWTAARSLVDQPQQSHAYGLEHRLTLTTTEERRVPNRFVRRPTTSAERTADSVELGSP